MKQIIIKFEDEVCDGYQQIKGAQVAIRFINKKQI